MSNEEDKIANWSPKLFKGRKPYEYGKKIETMDMETGFIEEEFQEGEEEEQMVFYIIDLFLSSFTLVVTIGIVWWLYHTISKRMINKQME